MEDLLAEVERAVRTRGWSARQASMMAVGTPELIRDMRRGRVPSVERFRTLCEVLGLEFYVGPPRSESPLEPERLERAIEYAEKMNDRSPNGLTHAERARIANWVYALMGEGVLMDEGIEDKGKTREQVSHGLAGAWSTGHPESAGSAKLSEPSEPSGSPGTLWGFLNSPAFHACVTYTVSHVSPEPPVFLSSPKSPKSPKSPESPESPEFPEFLEFPPSPEFLKSLESPTPPKPPKSPKSPKSPGT